MRMNMSQNFQNISKTCFSGVETAPNRAAVGSVPVGRFFTLNKVLLWF